MEIPEKSVKKIRVISLPECTILRATYVVDGKEKFRCECQQEVDYYNRQQHYRSRYHNESMAEIIKMSEE